MIKLYPVRSIQLLPIIIGIGKDIRVKLQTSPSVKSNFKNTEFSLRRGGGRERYELLMEAAEGQGGVMICSKGGNKISDLMVLEGGDEGDLMVVEMKGTFDQETISKAVSSGTKGTKGAK